MELHDILMLYAIIACLNVMCSVSGPTLETSLSSPLEYLMQSVSAVYVVAYGLEA
jgi:hypothetical protein